MSILGPLFPLYVPQLPYPGLGLEPVVIQISFAISFASRSDFVPVPSFAAISLRLFLHAEIRWGDFFTPWKYYDVSELGIQSVCVCVAFALGELLGWLSGIDGVWLRLPGTPVWPSGFSAFFPCWTALGGSTGCTASDLEITHVVFRNLCVRCRPIQSVLCRIEKLLRRYQNHFIRFGTFFVRFRDHCVGFRNHSVGFKHYSVRLRNYRVGLENYCVRFRNNVVGFRHYSETTSAD